jgi:signal peptidase II
MSRDGLSQRSGVVGWGAVLVALVGLVGCDHATKYVAKAELENQPPQALLGSVLQLRYVENTDVAFNIFRWVPEEVRTPLLLGFGALLLLALAGALAVAVRKWRAAAIGTVLFAGMVVIFGGALGNYLDRLVRGYVVDFIHLRHWPVFNVADVWVVVGFALVAWGSREAKPAVAS